MIRTMPKAKRQRNQEDSDEGLAASEDSDIGKIQQHSEVDINLIKFDAKLESWISCWSTLKRL